MIITENSARVDLCYTSQNLTELPKIPITLTHLYCGFNKLTELPDLPICMRGLYCN